MADSTEMKSKNNPNRRDAELDAMFDEAELSLSALDSPETDDDVIDKLLLDAGFDVNEDLPSLIDDSVFADEFDEDFDLADISTDPPASDADIDPDDKFNEDHDFPMDLLESIANPDDEPQLDFTAEPAVLDDEIVPIVALDSNQDDIDTPDEDIAVFDDKNLIDTIDEFSNLDEFSDFQDFQDPTTLNNEAAADTSSSPGTAVPNDNASVQEAVDLSGVDIEESDLIVDVADLTELDTPVDYDEFGDDFDDDISPVPALTPVKADENQPASDEDFQPYDESDDNEITDDFDITAGIDDDFINSLEQNEYSEFNEQESAATADATEIEALSADPSKTTAEDLAGLIEAAGIPLLMQFKSDQETLNKKSKKQITDFETNVKKTNTITYVALGVAIVSLITAAVLGFMVYGAKTEIAKLTAIVTVLETQIPGISTKKITDDPANLTDAEKSQHTATLPENPAQSNPEIAKEEHKPETETIKTVPEPENHLTDQQTPPAEVAAKSTSASEPHHPEEPAKAEEHGQAIPEPHDVESKKIDSPKESTAVSEKKPAGSDEATSPLETIKTESHSIPEKTQPEEPKPSDIKKAKLDKADNKKSTTPTAKKKITVKNNHKTAPAVSNWSVNLIAYKQQWYASSKANEFINKGIPVEIIPVKLNNVTWYRLRVGGFSDKVDATAYAGRVKKALNLSSVWVGNK